jgi:hypothetical protein
MQPFNGTCIYNPESLNLSQLRDVLAAASLLLSAKYKDIHSFYDWHEHDGYIVDSKTDSWATINAAIENELALFGSRDEGYGVRIAFYPATFDWLLRYNVDQVDESDYRSATCDFDLSIAGGTDWSCVADSLFDRFADLLATTESLVWFTRNYGG